MLVGERMSHHPVTAGPEMPINEALQMMKDRKVRRLPVVDKRGHVVGIVSEKDLLYASPSPATTLSVWELNYLISRISVADIMTKNVITITEFTPLEEAACLMADNKIGGLPVIREGRLIGIITETDIFKTFIEMLGAREKGVRITLLVPEEAGILASITQEITKMGGNIVALGTFLGEDASNRTVMIKVADVGKDKLLQTMESLGMTAQDVREVAGACPE
jgi:acetoin utilization protein AcuB